jgi:hypothetical protein
MTAKEILAKVKAIFEAPIVPTAPVVPPVAPIAATTMKLKDGTEISITMKGTELAVGDTVMVAGALPAAGELELEDGTKITVDATGLITLVTPAAPVTQPEFVQPVVKTLEQRIADLESVVKAPGAMAAIEGTNGLTAEQVQEMYGKFATGSTEERIANLETMIKALMECNFGYQIRQGLENTAIQAYKDSLVPMQTQMAAATAQIAKDSEVIKGLFDLVETMSKEPSADPVTLTGRQKQQFERKSAKEERLEKYAEVMKKAREGAPK